MDSRSRLEGLYQVWQDLRPTSPPEQFDAFGAFFEASCTAWLKSMREWDRPSIGRENIVADVLASTKLHHLEERRVLSSLVSEDGRKVVCEMENRLSVVGRPLDPFYETAVATFSEEGLITEFKIYSCRSPIVSIVQAVTGRGPYTADVARQEFE